MKIRPKIFRHDKNSICPYCKNRWCKNCPIHKYTWNLGDEKELYGMAFLGEYSIQSVVHCPMFKQEVFLIDILEEIVKLIVTID